MREDDEPSSGVRAALIEAAARVIAIEGPSALTLRRLAEQVGTSTMAIYTHFGGMPQLRRAVRREGFARLAAQLAEVGESDDAVGDLARIGRAYYENALSDPNLYRVTFMEQPLETGDAAVGFEPFEVLVAAVQRCITEGRFRPADAPALAREFWAVGHGAITLQLARLLSADEALTCLEGAIEKLFVAYGDEPAAARGSLRRARHTPAAG